MASAVSDADSTDDMPKKKIKLSDDTDEEPVNPSIAEDLSAHSRLNSLESFKLERILSENNNSKSVFLEGRFDSTDEIAVVLLEKLPIAKDSVEKLLNAADLALNLKIPTVSPNTTDYACYPKVDRGDVKATIIYPATSKHVQKYQHQSRYIVNETPEVYNNIVLPHITSQKNSLQWVYNILEHKSEAERIVFEDPDPELGFVLLPDLKWDESEKDSVYFIAICHAKHVKSLRDLDADSLPLLKNIKTKSFSVIKEKYNIPSEKLRVFIHYQPSYYHFHIHFTSIQRHAPGSQFEKAHLLDTVINNIELFPSYYKDATLPFTLNELDPLLTKLKDASVISL
ncbi:hypothetical protein JTE90_003803 [Oedothorax gibbosus]|uniref:m7GpppX diphosphatase n=1 Tax=Oedothorax gibbosus TaxID=931172 RepID=A0AAV6V9A5_9ARAC|nr:hypothetical protein JTE90_003803 [Oedothorax gibbosus]